MKDSNIQDNAELLAKLRYSVVALNPCARRFLKLSAEEAKLLDSFAEDLKKECGEADRKMARPNLKLVRRTINEYRDDRYDRFVNLRNGTWSTMVFTGMTAFCLLAIAMIVAAPVHTVVAGMVFYLVGATVGLWGHLHNESKASGEISDYGLSTARLYSTPLYSGLAAVGGVVLTAVLPYAGDIFQPEPVARSSKVTTRASTNAPAATSTTNGVVIRNIASAISNTTPATEEHGIPKAAAGGSSANRKNPPSLEAIFDLERNLIGVLVAAIFGLTPSLLFNRLHEQSERYKSDLKSSETTQGQGK